MKRLLALTAPAAALALLVAPLASSVAAATEPDPLVAGAGAFPWPMREFCGRVQAYVTGSTARVTNTVHDGIESFERTPPQVQPLTTQQYDWPYDRGPPKSAARISCKLVTADRVKATHGAQAARAEGSCEQTATSTTRC